MLLNNLPQLFIYSPLEQFEIYTFVNTPTINQVYNFHVSYVDQLASIFQQFFYGAFTGSNAFFTVLNLVFLFMCFNHTLWFNEKLIAFSWQKGAQTYFTVIIKMIEELVSHPLSKQYFYIFFTFIFFLINMVNLFGLIPYTFVLTSQFFFTFGLAFIFFISLNLTGLVLHGYAFLTLFYPSGTPIFIVPLLVLIEFISYIARVFSLAIRLFANITAGHILVKILSWLTWMILDIFVISGLSFIIISALWVLEFFISILQAYVFLTLLCLYLNDVLQLH